MLLCPTTKKVTVIHKTSLSPFQLEIRLLLGVLFSLGSLLFAALGNIFSKTSGWSLKQELISAYIGLAIVVSGFVWLAVEPYIIAISGENDDDKKDDEVAFFPEDPWIWVQSVVVCLLGAYQQYCNICEYNSYPFFPHKFNSNGQLFHATYKI